MRLGILRIEPYIAVATIAMKIAPRVLSNFSFKGVTGEAIAVLGSCVSVTGSYISPQFLVCSGERLAWDLWERPSGCTVHSRIIPSRGTTSPSMGY